MSSSAEADYQLRIQSQIKQYEREGSLRPPQPETAVYYTKHFLQKRFHDVFGVNNHIEFYYQPFATSIRSTGSKHVASIGSGECDLELLVAQGLLKSGISEFVIHCLELSPILTDRAKIKTKEAGLEDRFAFHNVDVRDWCPAQKFAGYMAHHSLHHILRLENLFRVVKSSLTKGGVFLSCDMIGRNGHMRWPEAQELLDRLWHVLPREKRFHNI